MAEHVVKLPDVGEGVAEAELVEWHVKVGDIVREDDPLADVMTDKATVEIPSPVGGEVVWIGGEIGDTMAVGSALARVKVGGKDGAKDTKAKPKEESPATVEAPPAAPVVAREEEPPAPPAPPPAKPTATPIRAPASLARPTLRAKPIASPAVRLEAREAGVDMRQVGGTGPGGRITRDDLQAFIRQGPMAAGAPGLAARTEITEVKVVGLRRRIAEKMTLSKSRIPHITIVEEVNVTPLEDLRAVLNRKPNPERPKLTVLPFLMRALVKAIAEQPGLNALFDDDAGIIRQHAGVHIGIATQTPAGLTVPVVKHVEARDIWSCAAELVRLAERARDGTATRDELTGSTITITSLGALGAIATTPVINYPEVAIVGVNRMAIRPMWDGTAFVPRKMMNLSSSFDHRVIDGWDAAVFVQRLKELIENPATLFMDA
jgi:2-oxoisovalerate dehydrogenase E2 component (dihydrolipoyl transacylase)